MRRDNTVVLTIVASIALTVSLQGCGGNSPAPSSGGGWKLEPIEVKGSHLYGSRTGKQFFAKGMAFPNVDQIEGSTVDTWIQTLEKIHELGPQINTVRIYEFPDCAGGILGFGRNIINNFNFPNVLAIVLANEIEQNYQAFPVLKAYARDMKKQMELCNSHDDSPTKGKMRKIPLTYAATDTGNDALEQLTDYLTCSSSDVSLDIMGVNIERWTNDQGGNEEYKKLSELVGKKQWPAAFIHSEEGGPDADHKSRTWHQLKGFFSNYNHIDGYYAYAWYSAAHEYDMFDGLTVKANMYQDGKTFFEEMSKSGQDPAKTDPGKTQTPTCASKLTRGGATYVMVDFGKIKAYDTGPNAYPKNCPAAWQDAQLDEAVVV